VGGITKTRNRGLSRRFAGLVALLPVAFTAGWWSNSAFSLSAGDIERPSIAATPHANDATPRIQAFFSPRGGTRDAIIDRIDQARTEVLAALYFFTDAALADALIRARDRGARVEVILDRTQRKARGGQAQRLIDAGVPVHFDAKHRILHHKFAVIDASTVVTGSFNWTRSAETANAENTLVLHDRPDLAGQYIRSFAVLRRDAAPAESESATSMSQQKVRL